jgi:hypothetical protein
MELKEAIEILKTFNKWQRRKIKIDTKDLNRVCLAIDTVVIDHENNSCIIYSNSLDSSLT